MKNVKYIDKDNLLFNLHYFSGKKICAMVKANAYGHGIENIVPLIEKEVEMFGVVNIDEAKKVRRFTEKPILITSKAFDLSACKKNNLDIMVESVEDIKTALKYDLKDNLHLKIDCGMHRFGIGDFDELKKINAFFNQEKICLKAIYTHFSSVSDGFLTEKQYQKFLELKKFIDQDCKVSFGGSNIYSYDFDYDILRLGIGLYGYERENLKPVMKISSFVSKIETVDKGDFVGYDKKGEITKSGYIAVVPVGYGDGLSRKLCNKFSVEIQGRRFKSIGNICMDCFFVLVDEKIKVGDEVVILQDANVFATIEETISYEVLTNFSNFRGETLII